MDLLHQDGFGDADLCNNSQSAAGRAEDLPVNSGVLKALPNPSNGDFTLQLPFKLEKGVTARLNVFDQLGRLALTRIVLTRWAGKQRWCAYRRGRSRPICRGCPRGSTCSR